ncbi:hypothetical protein D3C76_1443780 [compost metagenome]
MSTGLHCLVRISSSFTAEPAPPMMALSSRVTNWEWVAARESTSASSMGLTKRMSTKVASSVSAAALA